MFIEEVVSHATFKAYCRKTLHEKILKFREVRGARSTWIPLVVCEAISRCLGRIIYQMWEIIIIISMIELC